MHVSYSEVTIKTSKRFVVAPLLLVSQKFYWRKHFVKDAAPEFNINPNSLIKKIQEFFNNLGVLEFIPLDRARRFSAYFCFYAYSLSCGPVIQTANSSRIESMTPQLQMGRGCGDFKILNNGWEGLEKKNILMDGKGIMGGGR